MYEYIFPLLSYLMFVFVMWHSFFISFVLCNRSFVRGYLTSFLSSLNNHSDVVYSSMVLVVAEFVWFVHHTVLNMKWWFFPIELVHRIVLLKYVRWRRYYFCSMKSSIRTSFGVNSTLWIDVYHLHRRSLGSFIWIMNGIKSTIR